jgi:uroporphyrin-III C-methyltransferase
MDDEKAGTVGHVTLVGGGPGSADLLTVAGADALRLADVVLFDRLAPHGVLGDLAPRALLVDVGKTPGHHPVTQADIEALLVRHALAGSNVVRLKGGDPYVFGRGSEEVIACHAAGVPVTVIPGVTSAIAVPAAAGIPLTHRGVSHLFTVVSGHAPLTDSELEHLAGLGGTIVVLMGVGTLPSITQGLVRHGASSGMPVAIIERGYSATQTTTIGTLGTIVFDAARAKVSSPAVLVIGEVVRLAHDGDAPAAALLARAEALADVS